MTSAWGKGRNKRYGYWLCRQRSCVRHGKSIRKNDIEGAFEELLKNLRPTPRLFQMAKDMFQKFWDARATDGEQKRRLLANELTTIEREIKTITKRLLVTDVAAAITTYERQLGKLETKKEVLREQTQQAIEPQKPFDEMFGLAWRFLSNPCILWEKGNYDHKRLLLRMTFTDKLAYCHENGFTDQLNRKIALPFGTYTDFEKNFGMVPRGGIEPPTLRFSVACSTN